MRNSPQPIASEPAGIKRAYLRTCIEAEPEGRITSVSPTLTLMVAPVATTPRITSTPGRPPAGKFTFASGVMLHRKAPKYPSSAASKPASRSGSLRRAGFTVTPPTFCQSNSSSRGGSSSARLNRCRMTLLYHQTIIFFAKDDSVSTQIRTEPLPPASATLLAPLRCTSRQTVPARLRRIRQSNMAIQLWGQPTIGVAINHYAPGFSRYIAMCARVRRHYHHHHHEVHGHCLTILPKRKRGSRVLSLQHR